MVLLADSLQGANWPGSEKAVNPNWVPGSGHMDIYKIYCIAISVITVRGMHNIEINSLNVNNFSTSCC